MGEKAKNTLAKTTLLAHGQMVIPLAVIGLPVNIYIPPFYGDTLGLDLALVGFILFAARLTDVITDPLVGRLSDLTQTRWGRRRPWILAGVPMMMMASYLLFFPPEIVSVWYLLGSVMLIYLGFTFIVIPYGAWGAELATDYNERSRITGYREIFLLVGVMLAITAPILSGISDADLPEGEQAQTASREAMSALGYLILVLMPICATILFWKVKEPKPTLVRHQPFFKSIRSVMRNGPFRIVLVSTMLSALAGSFNGSLAILFFDHVAQLEPLQGQLLIFTLITMGFFGAPIWIWAARNFQKQKVLACAGAISLSCFALVPVVIYGLRPIAPDAVFFAFLVTSSLQGLCMAAGPILSQSILADIVDLDTIKNGGQRAGFLFAFLGMVRKIFDAAGLISLPIIAYFTFNPKLEENTPEALFSVLAMYCLVPLVLWTTATYVIWKYPITPERQARLRAALDRREARQALLMASSD